MKACPVTTTFALVICLLAAAAGAQPPDGAAAPGPRPASSPEGFWIVRIEVADRDAVDKLNERYDVWKIARGQGYVEAALSPAEYEELAAEGFRLEIDEEQTRALDRLGVPLKLQFTGIPGFPCYRTVEETYATAEAIVAAHPDLATWTDVGDSWDKTQNPQTGWDVFVLKLTQSAISGPKPVFFAHFAIHAREYTTAELGTRFAEMLVAGYGTDPDLTWLLDYHEVHLVLQANPDGRKRAETGLSWRKNVNNAYCSNTNSRGADLNRNFDFEWGCCGGSSGSQCNATFRGAAPASEPEIQALQAYAASIFPDQRGPGLGDPAPADATGVALDIHSSGQLVLWPWGFTSTTSPNGAAFATLGRKLAFFNGHSPQKTWDFTVVDGDSLDYYYGELGVAGLAYELGTQFFESCASFEANVLPGNLQSLLFAAKVARTPFLTPAGPEAMSAAATPSVVTAGTLVLVTATVDDARFNNSNGTEPTQTLAAAEAFVDVPPWEAGAVPLSMSASDGTFDESAEGVEVTIDTSWLTVGRHTVFVQGTDTAGNEGVVAAAFLDVVPPCTTDPECDDGLFCNGTETCNAGTCQAGFDPCSGGLTCDEAGDVCVAAGPVILMSFKADTAVPGVGTVANEDVVGYDEGLGTWSLHFDGSDVGLASLEIDGLAELPGGDLLLSFTDAATISGIAVDDSDVVRFTPTSLGATTAGTFSLYFDGSDVGLTASGEDVDAIALAADGRLIVSTTDAFSGTGASGADEDLFLFTGTLGASTSGSFALYFDGSDVALTATDEDVDGASLTAAGDLLFSTLGNFSVSGLAGANEDVGQFSGTFGSTTSGTFSMRLDLSALGISTSADVGDLHVVE